MPEISMCTNKDCPSKETCWRFKAPPKPFWQSYCGFVVYDDEDKCEHYMEMEDEDEGRS